MEIVLIGVGLSMDAFAVSVIEGISLKRGGIAIGVISALSFGLFQGLMPLLGWFLGSGFSQVLDQYGPWIAFALLAIIGAKMIVDAMHGDDDENSQAAKLAGEGEGKRRLSASKLAEILMLSVATSIDALAVGVSFAFLDVSIWAASSIIALTTFLLSMLGVLIGKLFGSRFEKPAQMIGGIVLIAIGAKIVIEHMLGA